MKICWYFLLGAVLIAAAGVSPARASGGLAGSGDPFTLYFDENGNGFVDHRDGTGLHVLNGTLLAPPTGGSVPVLTFMLPSPVVTGDVRIWEDKLGGTLSDVLRFTNANGSLDGGLNGDRLIVYSDIEPGEKNPALADTGIPVTLFPRDGGGLVEVGPEGNNGVDYFPGSTADNIYHFVSDGSIVPEPASVVLLGVGAVAAVGCGWRRGRRRTSTV